MKKGIKIKLNYLQWELFRTLIVIIIKQAPIADWQLESYVMIELYKRLIYRLTVWEGNSNNKMSILLKYSEAHAINNFWSCHDDAYNMYLRPLIESQLPPAKEFEGVKEKMEA